MKRIYDKNVIIATLSVNEGETNFDVQLERIVNPSFNLRFIPISTSNGNFGLPKVGFEKTY